MLELHWWGAARILLNVDELCGCSLRIASRLESCGNDAKEVGWKGECRRVQRT